MQRSLCIQSTVGLFPKEVISPLFSLFLSALGADTSVRRGHLTCIVTLKREEASRIRNLLKTTMTSENHFEVTRNLVLYWVEGWTIVFVATIGNIA